MHVPSPSWIQINHATVPADSIDRAADILRKHFADLYDGADELGGERWWTLRGRPLEGEYIEMRRDFLKRTLDKTQIAVGEKEAPYRQDEKVILYLHGGAYFFSSLDTHRYQIQRHARLLGGRAFAPSYRLAPQYPFPCGLQDALASYLYLVSPPPHAAHPAISPANIIISGDSAGAGLVLALLCVIRDSGGEVPMPAGATLISPWVDLSHSFRSIMADDSTDYIPSEGFHYRPSLAWPPVAGDAIDIEIEHPKTGQRETRVLDEQIQMYTSNRMISHPLVSLINQGSLGGLCPLLIVRCCVFLERRKILRQLADPFWPTPRPVARASCFATSRSSSRTRQLTRRSTRPPTPSSNATPSRRRSSTSIPLPRSSSRCTVRVPRPSARSARQRLTSDSTHRWRRSCHADPQLHRSGEGDVPCDGQVRPACSWFSLHFRS
jgi:acetyl esterase/lipase